MIGARTRALTLAAAAAAALVLFAAPALCLESQLAGISLGDTPEEMLASPDYGSPDGLFTPGNVFNSISAGPGQTSDWALAVKMAQVAPGQVEWVYNRDPVAIGVLFTGEGINAHVTDIIVSMWKEFRPSMLGKTSKEIQLGSAFADVLAQYGWPNRLQIISETGQAQSQGPAQAARPGTAPRPGGVRLSFGSGHGGSSAPAPLPRVGGAFAMRLARRPGPAGPGPLPSVGPARVGTARTGPAFSTSAAVGQTPGVTFTKSCIMSYPSVDFVIYRMQVFRIHIYGQ